MANPNEYCAIIVYGDIGRSPRMQNHAVEISKHTNLSIYLIGYDENRPNEKVASDPKIQVISLSNKFVDFLKRLPRIFYLFYALMRIIIQIFQIIYLFFFKLPNPKFILVQNPPSIPVLSTVYLISKIKGICFLVDIHNYGFTILELNIKNKIILFLAKLYEKFFAKQADCHFCVSHAMRNDLFKKWGIRAICLYDKANLDLFKPINMEEKQNFLKKMNFFNQSENFFSSQQKPIVLISSTSWTKDEDFGVILKAMELYEEASKNEGMIYYFPKIILFITGKGPEKKHYEGLIEERKKNWKKIDIITLWLEIEDYPKMLAVADIGVCLHYSSSGLDLPMKVVDMLSCGLPILAINYESINELVADNENGRIFNDSHHLYIILRELLEDYPKNKSLLEKFKANALKFREFSFQEEWKQNVFPIIKSITNGESKWKKKNLTLSFLLSLIPFIWLVIKMLISIKELLF